MRFWHSLLSTAAALGLLVLLACAGRPHPAVGVEPLLGYEQQPDSCAASPVPSQLPAVGDVVDTGALRQRLAPALTQGAPLTATIEFASDGSVHRLAVLGAVTDSQTIALLSVAVGSSLRPQPPAPAWSVRLRFPPDGAATSVERSEFCPPVPLGSPGPQLGRAIAPMTLDQIEELRRAGPFRIRLLVDRTGVVTQANLVQSSGSSFQDRFALDRARQRRFRPALLDGVPVPAWYEVRSRR